MTPIEVANDEAASELEAELPDVSVSLPYPIANLGRLLKGITTRMNQAIADRHVIGWACSISRADGSHVHLDAGGFTVVPRQVPELGPAQTGKGPTGGQIVVGYTKTKTKGVVMTPHQPIAIGSCTKVITATAALAAQWAISTNFGTRAPRDLVHLRDVISLKELQVAAGEIKIANHLPSDWDLSRVNGQGKFSSQNAFTSGQPQKTKILLEHVLQMRSYIEKSVSSRYTPPDHIGAVGHYQNVQRAIEIGPVVGLVPSGHATFMVQKIGSGNGVYSNSGYAMLRILTAYSLARVPALISTNPNFDTLPSVSALDAMPWRLRDYFTALIHAQFVKDHVFKPCGVDGWLHPVGDVRYYDVGQPNTSPDFEYTPTNSSFLTVGGGGWDLSADGLRKFLVGLQQGKPFGSNASWWKDVMWNYYYGADCPWLSGQAVSTVVLPGGKKRRTYHKNGGSKFPFLNSSGAYASARAQLFITGDATVVLLANSYDKPKKQPNLERIITDAYFDAVKGGA